MTSEGGLDVQLRASQACLSCRKQKRKCDKAVPACSLCLRMTRACDYSDSTPVPNADELALLRQKVAELESRLDANSASTGSNGGILFTPESLSPDSALPFMSTTGTRSTFPAIFFLDSQVYADARLSIPRPTVQITHDVLLTLGSLTNVHRTIETFFSTIHVWMPIVSKKRLQL